MDNAAARQAGTVFETLVVQMLLAPLAREESVLGAYGTACIAESIARADGRGFGALVAQALERRRE